MSLINQMLKDLEARRSANPSLTHLPSPPETANRPATPPWPLYLLGVGLLLLALLSGYLLWERQGHLQDTQTVTATPSSAPVAQTLPAQPIPEPAPVMATAAPIAPETDSPPPPIEPAAIEAQIPVSSPVTEPEALPKPVAVAAAPKPVPASPAAMQPPATPATAPQIERRARPPSPEQVAEQHYQQGYRLLQQAEQGAGEQQWMQAIEAYPAHIPAREGLVGLYLNQGRKVEANKLLREGLEHQAGYGQFRLLLARLQLEDGEQQQAITTLEQGLLRQPQGADYLAFLAALYQREQHYEQSIAFYQRALSQQPQQSTWWMGLGISLEGAEKRSEARQAYRESLERKGLSPALQDYVQQRLRELR